MRNCVCAASRLRIPRFRDHFQGDLITLYSRFVSFTLNFFSFCFSFSKMKYIINLFFTTCSHIFRNFFFRRLARVSNRVGPIVPLDQAAVVINFRDYTNAIGRTFFTDNVSAFLLLQIIIITIIELIVRDLATLPSIISRVPFRLDNGIGFTPTPLFTLISVNYENEKKTKLMKTHRTERLRRPKGTL